jgi:hypothetical protein
MAMQTVTVTLTAASSATFTFTKPAGNYGKTAPGLSVDATVAAVYGADVDNGNGTMTGTLTLSGAVTGTAEITIYDHA